MLLVKAGISSCERQDAGDPLQGWSIPAPKLPGGIASTVQSLLGFRQADDVEKSRTGEHLCVEAPGSWDSYTLHPNSDQQGAARR